MKNFMSTWTRILNCYRALSRGKDLTKKNTFIKTRNDLNIIQDFTCLSL